MSGDLIWIDLSTFDVEQAKAFYHAVFQWRFDEDGPDYVHCSSSSGPCAGLYPMPELFQKIRMPSFWMTYISVTDIDSVARKARELGGKVELEESNARGRIALIRDPAGAGFTCYEGSLKDAQSANGGHGSWTGSELFVSDLSTVQDFYTTLFGWRFDDDPHDADRRPIHNDRGERVGAVQVASNEIKGDKEFWAAFFAVDDVKQALDRVSAAGGRLIYEYATSDGARYLVQDSQGAALFLSAPRPLRAAPERGPKPIAGKARFKWRALTGLIAVYLALVLEADWVWGAFFLSWAIHDLRHGATHFIEPLSRRQDPALYWAVVLTWIGLAAYLLFAGF